MQCFTRRFGEVGPDQFDLARVRLDVVHLFDRVPEDLGKQSPHAAAQHQHVPRRRVLAHPEMSERYQRIRIGERGRHLSVTVERVLFRQLADREVLVFGFHLGPELVRRRDVLPAALDQALVKRIAG